MCSLCFKGKSGAVDFIKADVLTCLCGSFKDKQQAAHSCLEVTPWVKADKALKKGSPTFVMTVLGHDTVVSTQREDFIFSLQNSIYFSTTTSGSLSAIIPLQFYSLHFVILSSNSLISKCSQAFMACFRMWLQPKKYFARMFQWLTRAKQLLLFFALAATAPQSPDLTSPHLLPSGKSLGGQGGRWRLWDILENPPLSSAGIFQPCPVHFAEWEPVGINHKTLVSDQLRFSLPCWHTFMVGLQFLNISMHQP